MGDGVHSDSCLGLDLLLARSACVADSQRDGLVHHQCGGRPVLGAAGTFPAIQCATNVGYCFANGEKSLFKADQMAGQFCYASRAEAETHVASFNSVTPVYEKVDFKP
jgi:hypothetical protein